MKEFCDSYKIMFIPAHRPQLRTVLRCSNFPHFCTDLAIRKFKPVPSSDPYKRKPQWISVVVDHRNIKFFSKYFSPAIMIKLQLDPTWTAVSWIFHWKLGPWFSWEARHLIPTKSRAGTELPLRIWDVHFSFYLNYCLTLLSAYKR